MSELGEAAAPAPDDGVDDHLLLLPPPDGDAVAAGPGVKSAGPPVFLLEPTDAFAVRLRPARLTCSAANALTVYFRCSGGQSRREPSRFSEHVNPHSGVRFVEAVLEVTREDVDEFFGKDKLKCDCVAWSSQGEVRSQPAAIDVACESHMPLFAQIADTCFPSFPYITFRRMRSRIHKLLPLATLLCN